MRMVNWVEVKSFTLTTDKDVYNLGDTIHAQCIVETGSGNSTSARIVLSGITTAIKTFTIYPNSKYQIDIDISIPSDFNSGTYTLTAELDEYWEGPTPV